MAVKNRLKNRKQYEMPLLHAALDITHTPPTEKQRRKAYQNAVRKVRRVRPMRFTETTRRKKNATARATWR